VKTTNCLQDLARWVGAAGGGSSSESRGSAWIVSFGSVGSRRDAYVIRAEATARALEETGFTVEVLEISNRTTALQLSRGISIHPLGGRLTPGARVMGSVDLVAEFRKQVGIIVGLIKHSRDLRGSQVLVIEGGLLLMALLLGRLPLGKRRPLLVFDVITVMSALHRHGFETDAEGTVNRCRVSCRLRRGAWWLIELLGSKAADVTVVILSLIHI